MSEVITFENQKYTWEDIDGKRCLVPYKDEYEKVDAGQVWADSGFNYIIVNWAQVDKYNSRTTNDFWAAAITSSLCKGEMREQYSFTSKEKLIEKMRYWRSKRIS